MNDMPLVSIITPMYNSERFISETIRSVLSQTYQNWELWLVDDKSTDSTVAIAEEFSRQDERIQLIKNVENKGAAVSRNNGIKKAKGKYVAFLDGDDKWLAEKLWVQIEAMEKKSWDFCYCEYYWINADGERIGKRGVRPKVNYHNLLKTCDIGFLTAVYNAEKLGKQYIPIIDKRQDYALDLCLLKLVDYAYAIPGIWAEYRVHENSLSANKKSAAIYQWKVYREIENLNVFNSAFYFAHYAFHGFKNQIVSRLKK